MNVATVWDRSSPNYGQNQFVKENGTSQFDITGEKEVLALISQAINNPDIENLDLLLANGRIVWMKNENSCDEFCECGGCDECHDTSSQDISDDDDYLYEYDDDDDDCLL